MIPLRFTRRSSRVLARQLGTGTRRTPPPGIAPPPAHGPHSNRGGGRNGAGSKELIAHSGPSKGFRLSVAAVGAAGFIAACAGWAYGYQQWLLKNRPGKLTEDLTPLSELSDLARYAVSGDVGDVGPLRGSGPFCIADGRLWHPAETSCPECDEQRLATSEAPRFESEGSLWCARHYPIHCGAHNCRACNVLLDHDKATTLVNGDIICHRHAADARCHCCGRVLMAPITQGISLCGMCSQDTVWDMETARQIFSEVSELPFDDAAECNFRWRYHWLQTLG